MDKPDRPDAALRRALFPLSTVLFPGGHLPLRIFEARYVDMVSACMRNNEEFGVVGISAGSEVGSGAQFHPVGTLARIESFDQGQDGLLNIAARGTRRFEVTDYETAKNGLASGHLRLLPETTEAVPPEYSNLQSLLQQVYSSHPELAPAEPWPQDDAAWLGWRLCELLPLPVAAKAQILALESAAARLASVAGYLAEPAAD